MKWQTRMEKKSSLFKFLGSVSLSGDLTVVDGSPGIVLFVHGSGSRRHSRRNRYIAKVLQDSGLGTLLFDLQKSKR
jgi:putative phosphoribosyl transferase